MFIAQIDISVIVPLYSEQENLTDNLKRICDFGQRSSKIYEIIVVEDGSSRINFEAASSLKKSYDGLKVLRSNQGRGRAIKKGFFEAKGGICAIFDANSPIDPGEIEQNLPLLKEGKDVITGSVSAQKQTLFDVIANAVLAKTAWSACCGLKLFRRNVLGALIARSYVRESGFDMEILFLAHKLKYQVQNSIKNTFDHSSKTTIRMWFNIIQIRAWHGAKVECKEHFIPEQEIALMAKSEETHWWFQAKSELIKRLIDGLSRPFGRILDAGCGTGKSLSLLKNYGKVSGCDVTDLSLKLSQEKKAGDLIQCNLESMAYKNETFDLITSFDVIEHVYQPKKVLSEFKRVLKPDGMIILSVPAFRFLWSPHDDALSHMRRYSKSDLQSTILETGFTIHKIGYFYCLIFPLVVVIRMVNRLIIRKKEQRYSDTAKRPSNLQNKLLTGLLKVEAALSTKIPLPFGTTLYTILSKAPNSPR